MMINIFYIQKLLLLCVLVLHNAKGSELAEEKDSLGHVPKKPLKQSVPAKYQGKDRVYKCNHPYSRFERFARFESDEDSYPLSSGFNDSRSSLGLLGINNELLKTHASASQGIGLSQAQRRNVEAVCQFEMKKMVLQFSEIGEK